MQAIVAVAAPTGGTAWIVSHLRAARADQQAVARDAVQMARDVSANSIAASRDVAMAALQSRSQQLQYQPALHDQYYSRHHGQQKFELCHNGHRLGGTKRLPSGRAYSKLPAPARAK